MAEKRSDVSTAEFIGPENNVDENVSVSNVVRSSTKVMTDKEGEEYPAYILDSFFPLKDAKDIVGVLAGRTV